MSLKQAVQDPSLFTRRLKIKSLTPVHLQKAVQMIHSDAESVRTGMDIEALQRRINEDISNGKLSSVAIGVLKQTSYGFFDGPAPFADNETNCAILLEEIARRSHRPTVRLLIHQYLEYFEPKRHGLRMLANWLATQVPRWDWSWRARMQHLALFDPDKVPKRLAADLMESEECIEDRAREIGLSVISLTGGLGTAAFGAACDQVAVQTSTTVKVSQERLVKWGLRPEGFIYSGHFPAFVSALLLPWRDTDPGTQHKALLMTSLEEIGADPRVNPAPWQRVKAEAPDAYSMLLQWLTKASVYQFFDIIDQIADQHMWKYRRAFWTSYLEAGYIDEAWVVFGTSGYYRAQDYARQNNVKFSYGRLESGGGRTADQSALIMRMGDLIVTEWSHSGKCNIYMPDDSYIPKLHQMRYSPGHLNCGRDQISHNGSPNLTWQHQVASIIRQQTMRTTSPDQWRPRK